jgi:hypothetical protein
VITRPGRNKKLATPRLAFFKNWYVNMEHQLDATIRVFIDLQDQLNMFRAKICPSSGAQD